VILARSASFEHSAQVPDPASRADSPEHEFRTATMNRVAADVRRRIPKPRFMGE